MASSSSSCSSSSSKTLMFITIFSLTSWISTAFFPGFENLGGMGSLAGSMQCMKTLLPCQEYLTSPVTPPSSCCVPLSEMLSTEPECLCGVFNNAVLLETFNVTIDQALKLPTACGHKVDTSVCSKGGAASPTSSASALAPPAPTPSAPSDETSPKKNSASGLTKVGGYGLAILFMSMMVSVSF